MPEQSQADDGWASARAAVRVAAEAPRPPAAVMLASSGAYYDWVVERCLEWYIEGDQDAAEAACQLYEHLLCLHPGTQRIGRGGVTSVMLREAAAQGQYMFSIEMRLRKPIEFQ